MLRYNVSLWLRLVARREIKECHTEQCLLYMSAYIFNEVLLKEHTETNVAGRKVRVTKATALMAAPSSFVPLLIERRISLWL